jgi:Fe-S cluster assembly protein SufD
MWTPAAIDSRLSRPFAPFCQIMLTTLEKAPDFATRAVSEYERQIERRTNESNELLAEIRRKAVESFTRLGIPSRRHEAWKYTNIEKALRHEYRLVSEDDASRLVSDDVQQLLVPGLDAYVVVVVNGRYVPELSSGDQLPGKVHVGSLADAASAHGETVQTYFARYASVDEDAFVALNTAFALDGVFIEVPERIALERPIHVLYVTDADDDVLTQTRNLYVIGRAAQVTIVESFHRMGARQTFDNAVTEVVVGRDAHASVYKIQAGDDLASQINTTQAYQEASSTFRCFTFTLGGKLVRNNVNVVPNAEHCESHLIGLYVVSGTEHVDTHTLVDHASPNCFSNELYKGILDDQATGVFNGKVFVRRDAQKTNAYQSSQGVVLSDTANLYSKPELEIYADDVKCSHGSTTGAVDPDAMFYLRARGIAEREARAMLLYAFAHDVIDRVSNEPLREHLDALLARRLA